MYIHTYIHTYIYIYIYNSSGEEDPWECRIAKRQPACRLTDRFERVKLVMMFIVAYLFDLVCVLFVCRICFEMFVVCFHLLFLLVRFVRFDVFVELAMKC